MGPELGIANLPVLQDNLPLPISPHQPQPLQTSGHGGHTAGHRGQTLVLSKGQFLRSRASILTTLSYLLHYLCGNGGKQSIGLGWEPSYPPPQQLNRAASSNVFTLFLPQNCLLSDENEIYLRHFLPALGNFTQGMYRGRGSSATQ